MADWTKAMQQTYEYYIVDPESWYDVSPIQNVLSCTIERDSEAGTLGSASISMEELIGECYIRVYLVTVQNGVRERHPLGTFLVQTPSSSFDGKVQEITVDAYTPLLELKENPPPLGFSVMKGDNVMQRAYDLTLDNLRAPVVKPSCDIDLYNDFVANTDDTWLTFLTDLMANAKYKFDIDEIGRILFSPDQEIASLQPVWTFDDGNSSILLPSVTMTHDLYGIPNVVEVVYSDSKNFYYARVVNDDKNSPTSTVNRGREIIHRVTNPSQLGNPTGDQLKEYADKLLRELSSVEYKVTYTHGYCPVRVGDCVRLNYTRSGFGEIKAKVVSQSIKCVSGCEVVETAVFTKKMWR